MISVISHLIDYDYRTSIARVSTSYVDASKLQHRHKPDANIAKLAPVAKPAFLRDRMNVYIAFLGLMNDKFEIPDAKSKFDIC